MAVTRRPVQIDDLDRFCTMPEAQIAPDGSRVAYVVSRVDREADEYRSAIWLVASDGGQPVQFTSGLRNDSAPRWSPDGTRIAFISNRDGRPQLFLIAAGGGEPRRLTDLPDGAGPALWSPDGRRIAFSALVRFDEPPTDAKQRERWDLRPRPVERVRYKRDGLGFTADRRGQIFVLDLDGSGPRRIAAGEFDDREPVWSPDGGTLAFISARHEERELDDLADLLLVDAAGGEPRPLCRLAGLKAPAFSPDGSQIAVIATGTDPLEHGRDAHVWLIPASGGTVRDLTPGYDRGLVTVPPPAPTPRPVWIDGGRRILANVADRGTTGLVMIDVPDGSVVQPAPVERTVTAWSATPDGRAAIVFSTGAVPADLMVLDVATGSERRLTRINEELLAELELPVPERRRFTTPHGEVDGWVTRSAGNAGPGPLLLDIHGGPHGMFSSSFPLGAFHWLVAAARGWTVLGINPSGSSSYGREFSDSLIGRWGEYDLPEQLAAVDALIAAGLVDPARLAVTGYSYGGFMTSWIAGHCGRFSAAVIGAPLTNLESASMSGDLLPSVLAWEMGGKSLQEKREVFRKHSPVQYLEDVSMPCLILHGEADERCPLSQGEEFFNGLRALGKPAEMVRYPGQSHGFRSNGRPSHRRDYYERTLAWIERFVPGAGSAREEAATAAAR